MGARARLDGALHVPDWTEASLYAKVAQLGIADAAQVQTQRGFIQKGKFPLQYYVDLYAPRIANAEEKATFAAPGASVGFGHMVVSETRLPNVLVNVVSSG